MKRTWVFSIPAAVFIGGFVLVGLSAEVNAQTHKPFVEFISKTTCPYCSYSHQALRELDVERKRDFNFVSLVCNMSSTAYNRARYDYNFFAYPTVMFDGGNYVSVGAGSVPSAKSTYTSYLNACQYRSVANLNLSLNVDWISKGKMNISVGVKNNGPSTYSGRVRVYITEIQSSLGWRDTQGYPYAYAFLDFALNQGIGVSPGLEQKLNTQWDGNLKGFTNLNYYNVMVHAVVFPNTGRTAYAYPPSQNPFVAYHVDASESAIPSALAPDTRFLSQNGGTIKFGLHAGIYNYFKQYLIAASLSGTSPGTPMPGNLVTLPLNMDAFTFFSINSANTPMFSNFLGKMDGSGVAAATLNSPAFPGTVGVKVHFAYALIDKFDFVSNPVTIEMTP